MFNSQRPSTDDLPTNGQLLRATAIAAITAGAILVTVVLPSEYGIDPTGVGRVAGFTQMGQIKQQLALEAAADEARVSAEAEAPQTVLAGNPDSTASDASEPSSDVTTLTLAPGEGAEIKLVMAKDSAVEYDWSAAGGAVNFDIHADAPDISYHGYGKGSNSGGEQGRLVAAFDGSHGWFWRNRSGGAVTITLRTQGNYTEIKRVV